MNQHFSFSIIVFNLEFFILKRVQFNSFVEFIELLYCVVGIQKQALKSWIHIYLRQIENPNGSSRKFLSIVSRYGAIFGIEVLSGFARRAK